MALDRHLSLAMLSLITIFCCSNDNTRLMSRMHDGGTNSEFEELKDYSDGCSFRQLITFIALLLIYAPPLRITIRCGERQVV